MLLESRIHRHTLLGGLLACFSLRCSVSHDKRKVLTFGSQCILWLALASHGHILQFRKQSFNSLTPQTVDMALSSCSKPGPLRTFEGLED